MISGHRRKTAVVYLLLTLLAGFSMLPLAWAFVSSLKPLDEVYAFPPEFGIDQPQWSNYKEAFTRLPLARFLVNSFVIALPAAAGAVLTSSMAGYALARISFFGRTLCLYLVVASLLIPSQVLLIPRFLFFDFLGWVGTYKPLIVPAWLGGGAFNMLLFRQVFRAMPPASEEAALLDGASHWQAYWHVMLPAARPAVVTCAVLSFVFHWQEFLDPLIYLSDFRTYPVSLGLRMYQSMAGTWANLLMAASLIALLPLALVFIFGERHIVRGLGALVGRSQTS